MSASVSHLSRAADYAGAAFTHDLKRACQQSEMFSAILQVSTLLPLLQLSAAQVWPPSGNFLYGYNPQPPPAVNPYVPAQPIPTGFPANGFVPVWNNPGIPANQLPFNGIPVQPPVPRLVPARIELACEVPPGVAQKIRWIKQESLTPASTATVIAEDTTAYLPQVFSVRVQAAQNGATRSVLALTNPEPELNQAVFYCQSWDPATGLQSPSREVYILGHRQFINANLNYQAVDYGKRSITQEVRAPADVFPVPDYAKMNLNGTIYHESNGN